MADEDSKSVLPAQMNQDQTTVSTKLNSVRTKPSILYYLPLLYAFLCMGFGTGITSSTLLKLGEQTDSTVNQLTSVFFTRSCGFFVGSMLAGLLIDRYHNFGNMFLTIAIFLMSATALLVPFIYRLILLIPLQLMWGIAAGIVDNVAQLLTMRYYSGHNVGPYLQALHSAFGIGAFVSPLVVAPFLSRRQNQRQWHYAYFIIFLLHLPDVIWLLCHTVRNEWNNKSETKQALASESEAEKFMDTDRSIIVPKTKPIRRQLLFVLLLAPFLFCYMGGQYGFIAYLHTYATLKLHFSTDTAAYLNSAFWASLVIGRLCGIVFSLKLSPHRMIFGNLTCCITSLILLLVWHKLSLVLWFGTILFGFSIASIYSSTMTYAQTHIHMTGRRISMLAIAATLGDATIPLLVGTSLNSTIFGYPNFIIVVLSIIVLASITFVLNVLCFVPRSEPSDTNVQAECDIQSETSRKTTASPNLNLKEL